MLLAPLWAFAQNDIAPELLTLARIKVKAAENLKRLPNYTCLETIERSRRRAPSKRYELLDTVRLEVAVVGGKELFAWPGGGQFEERELSKMVPGGAIGNGNFALHARSVFLSNAAMFTYAGERYRDDRRTIRFDYRIPRMFSGYTIRVGETRGVVGYRGSLWVEAESLDLLRLEVHAEDIPPNLPIQSATDTMEYARVPIGESDFLLPQSSELVMIDMAGGESRNRTAFSGCRQYAGESVLSFAEPPPETPKAVLPVIELITLPPGTLLNLALDGEISSKTSAVGDVINATVISPVKKDGVVIVPKGARVSGRITRLERRSGAYAYYSVGISFSSIEFENKRSQIDGNLVEHGRFTGMQPVPRALGLSVLQTPASPNTFYVQGGQFRLSRGHRLTWRTETTP
jgi:hypothetical protein